MARQFIMTWNRKQKRWFKKLNKKPYAVSCKALAVAYPGLYQDDTEQGSYRAANQWWQEKLITLDEEGQLRRKLADIQSQIADLTTASEYSRQQQALSDQLKALLTPTPIATGPSIADVKTEFLSAKHSQVGNGLSAGRYANLDRHLKTFLAFTGEDKSITDVNASLMQAYVIHLNDKVKDKTYQPSTARAILETAKQLMNWSEEAEKIERCPRNLRSLTISVPNGKIKTYTLDALKLLMKAPMTERTRLYALIMLNTGMTQQDISDLTQDEIDWENHTITRKRSKTRACQNAPVVTYPLWAETYALLVKHRATTGDKVLTTRDGNDLMRSELVAGRLKKQDVIRKAWAEVKSPVKMPLKYFRKTSATLLGGNREYASVSQLFLGHAPQTIADKHYVKSPMDLLSDGVKWLGSQYGIG